MTDARLLASPVEAPLDTKKPAVISGSESGRYWARRRGPEASSPFYAASTVPEFASVRPATLNLVPGLVPSPKAASMIAASRSAGA